MNNEFKRQLVAILYADVVGYSRLTAQDEDRTHHALRQTLDVLTEHVRQHEGTIVHFAGDAVLAKFDTIAAALTCALEAQEHLSTLNKHTLPDESVKIRIGVNLGDVIMDRDDIYGDGVNVAVRIQELAEPGGVCVSDNVRDAIGQNLPIDFEYMGEQKVKNIDRPIRTFRAVATDSGIVTKLVVRASKPSIAVLPFEYIGHDDTGFSDGLTEDVTRQLSCFRGLSVVAHHSSFIYRDRAIKVQEVGSELGVQYVLEGTIRKSGSRVRVTAQLIETDFGQHLWAESYDKESYDTLDLQTDVAQVICATLSGRLRVATQQYAINKSIDRLEPYDYILCGQALTGDTPENNVKARETFNRAIELDPTCARAYSGLAVTWLSDFLNDWGNDPEPELELAIENANKAIDCDDLDAKPHWLLGELRLYCADPDNALMHLDEATELNPNDTDVFAAKGVVLTYLSEADQAVKNLEKAISLNPYHPMWYLWALGLALYTSGEYRAAVRSLRKAIDRKPDFFTPYQHLTAVYACLSEFDKARESAEQATKKNPRFGSATVRERHPFQDADQLESYLEALRAGGLPV
ncbi:MAG: adenylate/guanylate cyclase domain-containing protein [Arenicellales bacterium]|nr:adenylate/guanylate cyclase domain-containing protein [Arenicellales bacterium]